MSARLARSLCGTASAALTRAPRAKLGTSRTGLRGPLSGSSAARKSSPRDRGLAPSARSSRTEDASAGPGLLVFCEVKTRRGDGFGSPLEAVRPDKVARLRRLAGRWLATHGIRVADLRFDVVAVLAVPGRQVEIEHVRGAF